MASLKLIRTLGYASERPISETEGKVKGKKKMSLAVSLVVLCCMTAALRPVTGSCFTPLTPGASSGCWGQCSARPQMLWNTIAKGHVGRVEHLLLSHASRTSEDRT